MDCNNLVDASGLKLRTTNNKRIKYFQKLSSNVEGFVMKIQILMPTAKEKEQSCSYFLIC